MNSFSINQNPSFTSRSPRIRDAQWVCQKVRSFTHVSTTHFAPNVQKLANKNMILYNKLVNTKPFEHFFVKSPEELKLVKIFTWHERLVERIMMARENWHVGTRDDYRRVGNILNQFKYEGLGNCGEDAYLAATILKLNGINNACVAKMKIDKSWIDHVVCAFNTDGSNFDGKSLKNTIIIDPWVGTADFAQNMFLKYKSIYQKFMFGIKPNSNIKLSKFDYVLFSSDELKVLQEKYKYLIYPKSKRGFMQKATPTSK